MIDGGPSFLDTSFVVAEFDRSDEHHARARSLRSRVGRVALVTTELVLIEVADALSGWNRKGAAEFVEGCLRSHEIQVVSVDRGLISAGLKLYTARPDKGWGLTDCISFQVMISLGILSAFTADRHFIQAGFRALMLEEA